MATYKRKHLSRGLLLVPEGWSMVIMVRNTVAGRQALEQQLEAYV